MALCATTLRVGYSWTERVVEDLKRTQIVQYAGASGDYHPLHSDEVYAMQVGGYKGIFAHGMLTMGITGKAVTNVVGPARITRFAVEFRSQVWPGDTLDTTVTVSAIRQQADGLVVDLALSTVNQDGRQVVTGSATAHVDP